MRFTEDHNNVIVQLVHDNSSNLRRAFETAAELTGHSVNSICYHYYRYLRNQISKQYSTKTKGHTKSNVKNDIRFNVARRITSLSNQLQKRQQQKRQTTFCISEKAHIKKELHKLTSML